MPIGGADPLWATAAFVPIAVQERLGQQIYAEGEAADATFNIISAVVAAYRLLKDTEHVVFRIVRSARQCMLRHPPRVEHAIRTLIGQRVFRIALGYEDVNDHDELFEISGLGQPEELPSLHSTTYRNMVS
jgi:hypothetical protein